MQRWSAAATSCRCLGIRSGDDTWLSFAIGGEFSTSNLLGETFLLWACVEKMVLKAPTRVMLIYVDVRQFDNLIVLTTIGLHECKTFQKAPRQARLQLQAVWRCWRICVGLPLSETLLSFDTCSLLKETKTLWIFNLLRPFTYHARYWNSNCLPIRKKKKRCFLKATVPHGFTSIQLSDRSKKRPMGTV